MKLIIGLGNPGSVYSRTRHNIGRRIVEALARQYQAEWKADKNLKSHWSVAKEGEISFVSAFPDLYMNESGEAVRLLVTRFGIDVKSNLLILLDDAALPFGRLRLRLKGTDGGHRGLRSIEKALESREYARLRLGIGPSAQSPKPLEEYVLSPFESEEEKQLKDILQRSAESCRLWLSGLVEKAMEYANRA